LTTKTVTLGVVVTSFLTLALGNTVMAFGTASQTAATSPLTVTTKSAGQGNQAMTEAAVTSLRERLGLSETEARSRFAAQTGLDALGKRLLTQLGEQHQAGAWIDPADGKLVVNVTDEQAAHTVQLAGARARTVAHSSAELRDITTELNHTRMPAGSAWNIEPQSDAVILEVPPGESFIPTHKHGNAMIIRQAPRATAQPTANVTQDAASTDAKTDIYGGLGIMVGELPDASICTSAFLAREAHPQPGGFTYLLTASHCGKVNTQVYRDDQKIGFISRLEFGPNDFATIAITNYNDWQPRPWVFTQTRPQPVTGGFEPSVTGVTVCKRGALTGYDCGPVLALNASFTTGKRVVITGVVKAALCAEDGDSGGPVMTTSGSGVLGVGLISGTAVTSGAKCQGVLWYEPLATALGSSLVLATTK
jgi:streptogrisin D